MAAEPRVGRAQDVAIHVLGPLELRTGLGQVTPQSPKERLLLAHLVVHARRTVSTDELIETVWGEHPPRTAGKALQNHVVRLRRLIEPAPDSHPIVLVTDPGGYRLDIPDDAIDARRFEQLAVVGRAALHDGRVSGAADALHHALALWRGRAFLGLESTPTVAREARRLDGLRLLALEDRIAADLELGRAREVIGELESQVDAEPLRERLWCLLVLALYRADRQAESLAALRRARDVLVEELGTEPGPALRDLQDKVLRQDPALELATRATRLPAALVPQPGPFVGRDAATAQLRSAWKRVTAGGSVTVAITGPVGAGVTRLAAELAAELADQGTPIEHVTGPSLGVVPPVATPTLRVVDLRGAEDDTPTLPQDVDVPGPRLVVLLARRPPVKPADLHLPLDPLDAGEARALVASYLGDSLDEHQVVEAIRHSGGWPGALHDQALTYALERATARVTQAASRARDVGRELAEARSELRDGVTEYRDAVERAEPVETGACPWRGLTTYDVQDARWYSGRERLVAELIALVAAGRFVAVVGSSGSGKSSLLRAGLLAAVEAGALPGSEGWETLVMRPGSHPMRELERVASRATESAGDDPSALLTRAARAHRAGSGLLLVIDQLEEAWTACEDPDERAEFLDALAEVVNTAPLCTVVVAVRADHVGSLAEHPVLTRELDNRTLLVGAASPEEVRRMIEHPAERAGLQLDVGLVDALVEDTGSAPGALPLLSTALTELWTMRQGRRLTLAAHLASGGLRGAVARLAEGAYARLDDEDRAAARVLLLRLAGPGAAGSVTRRRVALAELDALPNPRVNAVVEPLAAARLLTVDAETVEVAHEALFREWPRLRGWLEEKSAERTIRRRLSAATADWADSGRDPAEAWQGSSLAAALELLAAAPTELTVDEQAFLHAGRSRLDAQRQAAEDGARESARQNRRLRGLLVASAALLAAGSVAGVLAVHAQDQAQVAQGIAEQEARVAHARELAAAANAALPTDPELSVLLATRAIQTTRAPEGWALHEAEEALHRAVVGSRVVDVLTGVGGSVVLSPDGSEFVPEGPEGSRVVEVHDVRSGELLRSWEAHDVDLNAVAISANGTLATAGDDGTVAAWELGTGRELGRVPGPDRAEAVYNAQISSDGSVIAGGWSASQTVRVHDLRTGATRAFTDVDRAWVLALSPSGARIALARQEGRVAVFDVESGRLVVALAGTDTWAEDLAWSPDGRWVAGLDGRSGRVWDAATGEQVASLRPWHTGDAQVITWSPDSTMVTSGGHDGTARLWRLVDGEFEHVGVMSALSTRDGILGAAFSPDSRLLYTAGFDAESSITAFDISPAGSAEWATVASPRDWTALDFAPDGDQIYVGSERSSVSAVDPTTGRTLDTLGRAIEEARISEQLPRALEVSVDGLVATASQDGVRVVDPATAEEVFSYTPESWYPGGITWSPDGSLLAVAGHDDGRTVILDRAGSEVGQVQEAQPYISTSVAFSPDGTRLAVGREPLGVLLGEWGISIWDWRSRESRMTIDAEGQRLAFTQDGLLINADRRGPILVSDPGSGAVVARLTGHTGGTWSLDLSPDGTRLATVGRDGTVRLWDTTTWTEQMALPGHAGSGISVQFSPDGRRLATLGDDGLARVWAMDLEDLLRIAQTKVTRTLSLEECRQYLHVEDCSQAVIRS